MLISLFFLAQLLFAVAEAAFPQSGLHFPIYRRGGRFARHDSANLTTLSLRLFELQYRYSQTYRDIDGNRVVRRRRDDPQTATHLFDEVGSPGGWYARLEIGEPPQMLGIDIDMLSPDFYTIMTTSSRGSKYDTFASNTHSMAAQLQSSSFDTVTDPKQERVHPLCRASNDIFHISNGQAAVSIDLPICNPPKSSRHTLSASGTILGLGPGDTLSRVSSPHLIDQLLAKGSIQNRVWSVTLLDSETGILSLGGSIVKEIEEAKIRTEVELEHVDDSFLSPSLIDQETQKKLDLAIPPDSLLDQHFKWITVQGAASGWWTTLMAGVWINGFKVLKNQPVLLDINCPFILAPPLAIETIYDAIGGARPVDDVLAPSSSSWTDDEKADQSTNVSDTRFYAYPCLKAVNIAFEIAGWNFPVMNGHGTREDAIHGPAGGLFSLGKGASNGTGYCVGIVVENTIGINSNSSGMQDTWVLGSPFFRGLGVVFDMGSGKDGKGARIGLRSY